MSDPTPPALPPRHLDALVIGAGPAGLMAAEQLACAGRRVLIAEAKPSPARKFLMAGKSGLNLTKDEPLAAFCDAYDPDWIRPIVAAFGPASVMDWAQGLGVDLFTGSTGRVFPVEMKASPLLRHWLARLAGAGVVLQRNWRWTGWGAEDAEGTSPAASGPGRSFVFDTPEGPQTVTARQIILALGGASWARLGSDGAWAPLLAARGVEIAPFKPANMGFLVTWSAHMAPHFGQPVKGAALQAGGPTGPVSRGEFVISARGIEGGGIYALSATVRDGAALTLDLAPGRSLTEITGRLSRGRGRDSLSNWLRKSLKFDPLRLALLREWGGPLPGDAAALAGLIKALPVRHQGPRPMDEAISTAGGIRREALTEGLELRALPGVFACGEMLDWEAPTGGYLLTGCLATGRHAGRAAAGLSD
ncbi:TIGR03862 family flavoprotein [Phaeovulum sp. W22_SRMD_FR3]|uniref:TIGR03862 family flavoprotein n=1 Tax=Phaeovulum sp. W22_SRMD_FR3 TaxID=3240274 RepID=UPI003F979FC7